MKVVTVANRRKGKVTIKAEKLLVTSCRKTLLKVNTLQHFNSNYTLENQCTTPVDDSRRVLWLNIDLEDSRTQINKTKQRK